MRVYRLTLCSTFAALTGAPEPRMTRILSGVDGDVLIMVADGHDPSMGRDGDDRIVGRTTPEVSSVRGKYLRLDGVRGQRQAPNTINDFEPCD